MCCPHAVRDGDASAQVTNVTLQSAPHFLCTPGSPLALPLQRACAKSTVQNYVFKYLGFHQLCKLSPSIKVAVWVLCWGAGLRHAPGSLCPTQPWPQGAWDQARWLGASLLAQEPRALLLPHHSQVLLAGNPGPCVPTVGWDGVVQGTGWDRCCPRLEQRVL